MSTTNTALLAGSCVSSRSTACCELYQRGAALFVEGCVDEDEAIGLLDQEAVMRAADELQDALAHFDGCDRFIDAAEGQADGVE